MVGSIKKSEWKVRQERILDYVQTLKNVEAQCEDKIAFGIAMSRLLESKRIEKKAKKEISDAQAKLEDLKKKYGK